MPTATRTFRVFISSTFEDLKAERNALQDRVFPELVKFCAGKGARFQAIDLRWGVREEAGLDQRTMEICLAEIARCQKTGIKPNFIVLLGDRYGQIPLPARIRKDEFEALLTHVTAEERELLVFDDAVASENNGWYRLDWNAVPPEYLLKPREGEYKERSRWEPIKTRMREALRKAAHAAGLLESHLVKYEASATHQEVLAGLGAEPKDREHVFAFLRNPEAANDPELKGLIETLRGKLPAATLVRFSERDLDGLCQQVTERLKKVIEAEGARFQSQSALDQEKEAHSAFGRDRCQHFVGRTAVLGEIDAYLEGNDPRPLVVHGSSGCGKSAIIARASEERSGIRRFIGVTPESSNGLTLLRSLCAEIGEQYGQTGDLPVTFNELAVLFQDRLRLATSGRPLILFIDALDQLPAQDPAAGLSWLPPELPANCRLVLSITDVPAALANARLVPVGAFSIKEAGETLDHWLEDAKRTLQLDQRHRLLESFRQNELPLYLKLAFEEARLWRSFDPLVECILGNGLPGIIDTLFARLATPANHGEILVRHALGFLTAARYGLTEDEILDVLSADEEVWRDFVQRARHTPPENRLPVIVWSRLFHDLEPYLSERTAPGGTIIAFYHRQLSDRIITRRLTDPEGTTRHQALSRYFGAQPHWLQTDPPLPNARKTAELVYQLCQSGYWTEAERTLLDYGFLAAKCEAGMVMDLDGDFLNLRQTSRGDSLSQPRPIALAGEALRLSIPAISKDSKQLRGQLTGRLLGIDAPSIRELLAQASTPDGSQWLCPLSPSLTSPGGPISRVIQAHAASISGVSLSRDGRHVASTSADGQLRVWDTENGSLVCAIEDCGNSPSVLITQDAHYAVTTSADEVVNAWNISSGRGKTLNGKLHALGIRMSMSRSPEALLWSIDEGDSRLVLTSLNSGDETVLWRPSKDRTARGSGCLSADWRRFVFRTEEGTLTGWDLETREQIFESQLEKPDYLGLYVSDDGHRALLSLADGTIHIWDLDSGKERGKVRHDSGHLVAVAMTPDGKWALSASDNGVGRKGIRMSHQELDFGTLKLWDLDRGVELWTSTESFARIDFIAVNNAASTALSHSIDGTLRLWDLGARTETLVVGGYSEITAIAATPDLAFAVTANAYGALTVWRLDRGARPSAMLGHQHCVIGVALAPSAGTAVSIAEFERLRAWDVERARPANWHSESFESQFGGRITGLTISSDGRRAFLANVFNSVEEWDLHEGREVGRHGGPSDSAEAVSVSGDGRIAVTITGRGQIESWQLSDGAQICTSPGNGEKLALSADATCAVVAEGRELWAWNTASGAKISAVTLPRFVTCLAISHNGRIALAGTQGGPVWLWDLQDGKAVKILDDHNGSVSSVAIAHNAGRAVCTSGDRTVRLWQILDGMSIATFYCDGPLTTCAISGDGSVIMINMASKRGMRGICIVVKKAGPA